MDVRGILGVAATSATASAVTHDIDADANPAEIKALVAQSQKALGRVRHHHQPH
jgi:hypothetical protein